MEQAYAQKLIGRTRIKEALARASGRKGTRGAAAPHCPLFRPAPDDPKRARTALPTAREREGLPQPIVNRHHATHRVDFAWPEHGLVVETDGRATHDNPFAFHQDHARDLDLELADLRVIGCPGGRS